MSASSAQKVQARRLAPAERVSPLSREQRAGIWPAFVSDETWIRYEIEVSGPEANPETLLFEKAGPRARIVFDPTNIRAAIVTCGGLCPGLNVVIRSLFLELYHHYGVTEVIGLRDGYRGLNPAVALPPYRLDTDLVDGIHKEGGTILGTSRGPQDVSVMTDYLEEAKIDLLFCIGGDGTQQGAHAIVEEITRRGRKIAVVGIPKTIDNDLLYCDFTFGYNTAIEKAAEVLHLAHVEAKAGVNGVGLVKVMGRDSGFIACGATLVNQEINYCLVPEQPFELDGSDGLLAALVRRMDEREHALIVVAEGAGQHLFPSGKAGRDASGNGLFHDIGPFLKDRIQTHFRMLDKPVDVKYIDPSYILRSQSANAFDSLLCDQLARRAVHAAMSGRTDVLVCNHANNFIHVPIPMAAQGRKRVDVHGELWNAVLAATGQPVCLGG